LQKLFAILLLFSCSLRFFSFLKVVSNIIIIFMQFALLLQDPRLTQERSQWILAARCLLVPRFLTFVTVILYRVPQLWTR